MASSQVLATEDVARYARTQLRALQSERAEFKKLMGAVSMVLRSSDDVCLCGHCVVYQASVRRN